VIFRPNNGSAERAAVAHSTNQFWPGKTKLGLRQEESRAGRGHGQPGKDPGRDHAQRCRRWSAMRRASTSRSVSALSHEKGTREKKTDELRALRARLPHPLEYPPGLTAPRAGLRGSVTPAEPEPSASARWASSSASRWSADRSPVGALPQPCDRSFDITPPDQEHSHPAGAGKSSWQAFLQDCDRFFDVSPLDQQLSQQDGAPASLVALMSGCAVADAECLESPRRGGHDVVHSRVTGGDVGW
jgi:hypothetical protein